MNEKKRKLDELDRLSREHDERSAKFARENEKRMLALLDQALAPAADEYADEIGRLAEQLFDLGLIDEEHPGKLELNTPFGLWRIEADHPDDGKRLYGRDGIDTIVATRMKPSGRYEHAVLDEHGMPIKWRTAHRPDLN